MNDRVLVPAKMAAGLQRFIIGLGKKVLLANQIGALWTEISTQKTGTVLGAWLGAIAFMFQIYFDFSGYSDMAIGLGHIFGFTFPENFKYPYISKSITEFWRRWHITLSTWFREYLYIPLGGKSTGQNQTDMEFVCSLEPDRALARGVLELCIVGHLLFYFAYHRKNIFRRKIGTIAGMAAACLYLPGRFIWLGDLCQ